MTPEDEFQLEWLDALPLVAEMARRDGYWLCVRYDENGEAMYRLTRDPEVAQKYEWKPPRREA